MLGERDQQERSRPVVLSLRPRFADAILNGDKSVELRRTRLAAAPGVLFILYASAPVSAVVGTATLAYSETDSPDRIWTRHGRRAGVTRAEFDTYFAGASFATALVVALPARLPRPATLDELRRLSGFRPPQSYRYLTDDDPQILHDFAS